MDTAPLWPFVLYVALVLAVVTGIVLLSHFLGERHEDRRRNEPYESGVPPTGTARLRVSAKFYLVAMCFVIFDVEAVFVFAWAAGAREAGWRGYAGLLVFLALLGAALVYLWRAGGLDWHRREREKGEA